MKDGVLRRLRRRAGQLPEPVKRPLRRLIRGRGAALPPQSVVRPGPMLEYRGWLTAADKASPRSGDGTGPLISILMPTYRTPLPYARHALDSVRAQTSPRWELCVVDDASGDPELLAMLRDESERDPRVRLVERVANGGISAALNDALAVATGTYVGVLDHDDALDPRTIEEFAAVLASHPETDIVYSDEDKIDELGQHHSPYCKPDFSPELLLAQMYLCHFTVFRASLVTSVGGFDPGTDGAQDHDLALRLSRTAPVVRHIPRVLYHWRSWPASTASGIKAKPWAQVAAAKVQRSALAAAGVPGEVMPSSVPGLNDVRPGINGRPRVSVVIPTAGTRVSSGSTSPRHVDLCLASLQSRAGWDETQIVIVHTGPLDEGQRRTYTDAYSAVLVPYDRDVFNFSHAINIGVAASSGEQVLLLNDDTRIATPGAVRALLEFAQLPGVGAVGSKLTYPDGRLQHVGMLMVGGLPTHPFHQAPGSEPGYFASTLTPRNYLAVTAAALMTPREAFDRVNGFDEGFAHDYNDVDYCLRLVDAGYRHVWTPYAHFTHYEKASIARDVADADETARFRARWSDRYPVDPYYSPRLSQNLGSLYEVL